MVMQRTLEYLQSSRRRFERMNQEIQALRRENQQLRELVGRLQGTPLPEPAPQCTVWGAVLTAVEASRA